MILLHPPLVAEPGKDGTAAHNPGASQCETRAPSSSSRTARSYSSFTPTARDRPARWSRPASPTRPAFSSSRRARGRRDDPRPQVICHEDLDTLAAPWVVPFVATALAQSKERYSSKIGEARLMIGNAIRM